MNQVQHDQSEWDFKTNDENQDSHSHSGDHRLDVEPPFTASYAELGIRKGKVWLIFKAIWNRLVTILRFDI